MARKKEIRLGGEHAGVGVQVQEANSELPSVAHILRHGSAQHRLRQRQSVWNARPAEQRVVPVKDLVAAVRSLHGNAETTGRDVRRINVAGGVAQDVGRTLRIATQEIPVPSEKRRLLKPQKVRAAMEAVATGTFDGRVHHADAGKKFLEIYRRPGSIDKRLAGAAQVIALQRHVGLAGSLRPKWRRNRTARRRVRIGHAADVKYVIRLREHAVRKEQNREEHSGRSRSSL